MTVENVLAAYHQAGLAVSVVRTLQGSRQRGSKRLGFVSESQNLCCRAGGQFI